MSIIITVSWFAIAKVKSGFQVPAGRIGTEGLFTHIILIIMDCIDFLLEFKQLVKDGQLLLVHLFDIVF